MKGVRNALSRIPLKQKDRIESLVQARDDSASPFANPEVLVNKNDGT